MKRRYVKDGRDILKSRLSVKYYSQESREYHTRRVFCTLTPNNTHTTRNFIFIYFFLDYYVFIFKRDACYIGT